jgi:hypothetical protein
MNFVVTALFVVLLWLFIGLLIYKVLAKVVGAETDDFYEIFVAALFGPFTLLLVGGIYLADAINQKWPKTTKKIVDWFNLKFY